MAKPRRHTPPPGWKNPLAPQQPLASARWILGAGLATLGLALLCVYITFCLLFWQGQWQLVFKPSRTISSTPASVGLKYDEIQFDATETGILQLNGWWIPADQPATDTLLFLHGNSGSLSDTLPQLQMLHQLGMNIFAFDYRGFGKSRNIHPSEKAPTKMQTQPGATLPGPAISLRPPLFSTGPVWARPSPPRQPLAIRRRRP